MDRRSEQSGSEDQKPAVCPPSLKKSQRLTIGLLIGSKRTNRQVQRTCDDLYDHIIYYMNSIVANRSSSSLHLSPNSFLDPLYFAEMFYSKRPWLEKL